MEAIFFDKVNELKREKVNLERTLGVKITIVGKKVTIEGTALEEYEAHTILDAMRFGFSARIALSLKESDFVFKKINIKDFTRRKNLTEVKGRVIGTKGVTKHTIEEISGCKINLYKNEVGVIGQAESVEEALTALTNLIRGSKQSNVYQFLEKLNASQREEGLGFKERMSEKTSKKYNKKDKDNNV